MAVFSYAPEHVDPSRAAQFRRMDGPLLLEYSRVPRKLTCLPRPVKARGDESSTLDSGRGTHRVSEPLPETAADPSAPAPLETQAELTATEARASLTEAASAEPVPSATRGVGRAALIEVLAYGTNIAIRLGSNLILTRLLFPKAFGLMALFHSVNYVLWMLSDVGITQAIVMSKRGN